MDTSGLDLLPTVAAEANENHVTYASGNQAQRLKYLLKIAAQRRYDQERYKGPDGDRIRAEKREASKLKANKIKKRARENKLYANDTERFITLFVESVARNRPVGPNFIRLSCIFNRSSTIYDNPVL